VIARFGGMSALVTQVLEPTIGNYFRTPRKAPTSSISSRIGLRGKTKRARRSLAPLLKDRLLT
jgi:hypothetical protein